MMKHQCINIPTILRRGGCLFLLLLLVQIGYAQENEGPITNDTTTIQDSTKKTLTKKILTPKTLTKKERRAKRRVEKRLERARRRAADSTWKPLRFAGIRLGSDILPTAFALLDENRTSYQGTLEVLLNNKYSIELSGGVEETIRRGSGEYRYTSSGNYGRIGINYNLLHKKTEDDVIYVGLHFGYAQFDHDITYTILNQLGDVTQQLAEKQLTGSWLEFNFGFRIELFKNLYMGPMFRIKAKLTGSEGELLTPSDIPGYGSNNGANFNFGYHLMYRLPFGKTKGSKRKRRVRAKRSKTGKGVPRNVEKLKKDDK